MRRALPLAAAALLAASSGCCSCLGSPTYTVRHGAGLHPGPAPAPLAGPTYRVLHLADFGEKTCQQEAVASAVVDAQRRAPFQLGVFPGDLLYPCGADPSVPGASACAFNADGNTVDRAFTPPADPASFGKHEDPLAPLADAPQVPLWLTLGNHDVSQCNNVVDPPANRLKACLEVAHVAPPLWQMPARHYYVDQGNARFVFVDTNLVVREYGGFTLDDEVAFVASMAADCETRLCFLVGHHPPVTAGMHWDDLARPEYVARMATLLDAGGGRIRAFLAGHDHDLEHLRTPEGLDVLISGNGSGTRGAEKFSETSRQGTQLFFASLRWGFGVVEIGANGWRYRFEGDDGSALYCCAAEATGPCEPVACR